MKELNEMNVADPAVGMPNTSSNAKVCADRAGCAPSTRRSSAAPANRRSAQKRKAAVVDQQVAVPAAQAAEPVASQEATKPADAVVWHVEDPLADNYAIVGRRLAAGGDVFRAPRAGLIIVPSSTSAPMVEVRNAADLDAALADRFPVEVRKKGQLMSRHIPGGDRAVMLRSDNFLEHFRDLDVVTSLPMHLPDFRLTVRGYNDGGAGHRIFYTGGPAKISDSLEFIERFIEVMAFAGNADRTNTIAAALTVKLRFHWPGAKPVIALTASKSQAGKDTICDFVAGRNRCTSIAYQPTDWAFERSFVGAFSHHPDTVVLKVDNARLYGGGDFIASGFLEGLITNPEPMLFSTGTGGPTSRANNFLVAITTNDGTLSTDLNNRSLPIRLEPVGNIEDRVSPIGNPRQEYLPARLDDIDAELNFMIERWKAAGQPLDTKVRHPFTAWAQTIGGILAVNGFTDFLGNYSLRKSVDDPLRKALGILGAAAIAKSDSLWLSPAEWAKLAVELGVVKVLIHDADRGSEQGRERGIGMVLTNHQGEVFRAETDDEHLQLKLNKARRRFEPSGKPTTRYQFEIIARRSIPADEEPTATSGTE